MADRWLTWTGVAGLTVTLLGASLALFLGSPDFRPLIALVPSLAIVAQPVIFVILSARSSALSRVLAFAVPIVFLAGIIPFGGYLAIGGAIGDYPWQLPALLALPSATFGFALVGGYLMREKESDSAGFDRWFSVSLTSTVVAGTALCAALFPGGEEISLLGASSSVVISLVGTGAALHPDPRRARHLAVIIARLSFLSLTVGISILYLIS